MISQKEIFLSRGYNVPDFVFDADGRKVEIETREDEEQTHRLDCIIKLLIKAGYFRAKIKGISPFDIVVGGMTWCIDSGDIDLDVDLLFEEGLSIGQKIALTEKIVIVLPKIKCPYFIEPHEIQGLNFIQIYPVIEWLINWSRENRERQAVYLRNYAINQYHKNFTDQRANNFRQAKKHAPDQVHRVKDEYHLKRLNMQTDESVKGKDIRMRLVSALAEYDFAIFEPSKKNYLKCSLDLNLNRAQNMLIRQGLSSQNFSEKKLNFKDSFHHISSDDHSLNARKKLHQLNRELCILNDHEVKLIPALQKEKQKRGDLISKLDAVNVDMNNLSLDDQQTVLDIQELIKKHDALREEEKNKKTSLKQELTDLQNNISDLENSTIDDEIKQLQIQVERFQKVLTSKKLTLAEIARNVTSKERELERIPTRAELSQYQKRFLELYRIHTLKTAEAKQDIMTYNMLDSRLKLIQKQVSLIGSIHENYSSIVADAIKQETFFAIMEKIVNGIFKTKEAVVYNKKTVADSKISIMAKLKFLQDEKTEYAKAVNLLNILYKKRHSTLEILERLNAAVENLKAAVEIAGKSASLAQSTAVATSSGTPSAEVIPNIAGRRDSI